MTDFNCREGCLWPLKRDYRDSLSRILGKEGPLAYFCCHLNFGLLCYAGTHARTYARTHQEMEVSFHTISLQDRKKGFSECLNSMLSQKPAFGSQTQGEETKRRLTSSEVELCSLLQCSLLYLRCRPPTSCCFHAALQFLVVKLRINRV